MLSFSNKEWNVIFLGMANFYKANAKLSQIGWLHLEVYVTKVSVTKKKSNVNTLSMLRNIAGDINIPIVVQLKATQKCLMFLLCISEPGALSIICGNNGILWKSLSCLKDGINTKKCSFDRKVQLITTTTEWIILNHLRFSKKKVNDGKRGIFKNIRSENLLNWNNQNWIIKIEDKEQVPV